MFSEKFNELNNLTIIEDSLEFTNDFNINQQKVSIRWDEIN